MAGAPAQTGAPSSKKSTVRQVSAGTPPGPGKPGQLDAGAAGARRGDGNGRVRGAKVDPDEACGVS